MQGTSCAGLGGLQISTARAVALPQASEMGCIGMGILRRKPSKSVSFYARFWSGRARRCSLFRREYSAGVIRDYLGRRGGSNPTLSVLTWLCVRSYGGFLILPTTLPPPVYWQRPGKS